MQLTVDSTITPVTYTTPVFLGGIYVMTLVKLGAAKSVGVNVQHHAGQHFFDADIYPRNGVGLHDWCIAVRHLPRPSQGKRTPGVKP